MAKTEKVGIAYTAEELDEEIQDLVNDKELVKYYRVVRKHNRLAALLEAKEKLTTEPATRS